MTIRLAEFARKNSIVGFSKFETWVRSYCGCLECLVKNETCVEAHGSSSLAGLYVFRRNMDGSHVSGREAMDSASMGKVVSRTAMEGWS